MRKVSPEVLMPEQTLCEKYAPIIKCLEREENLMRDKRNLNWKQYYRLENKILLVRNFHSTKAWKMCVPPSIVKRVLTAYHDQFRYFRVGRTYGMI